MRPILLSLAPLLLAAGAASAQAVDHSAHRPQTPPPAADPHAGHAMPAPAQDPHAGHRASAAPAQDPHAGHRAPTPDPHAGHAMSAAPAPAQDPHAGHAMAPAGPPDIPTSADDPGRPPEASPPAAAFIGPAHAADLYFDAAAMAAARERMRRENGDIRTTALVIDRLEVGRGEDADGWLWDVQGWTGGDINRLWLKSEAEAEAGEAPDEVEAQVLYSRAVRPFWDVQAGVRHDFRRGGEDVTHLVVGVQGLAPHWWEIDAAAFLSTEGDLTARVEAEYDQRLTQRLILQPRFEVELSAADVPERELGPGLGSIEAGVRLRYEIRKEFAPYVGVEWSRAFGDTADYVEAGGGEAEDVRLVAGLRAWF